MASLVRRHVAARLPAAWARLGSSASPGQSQLSIPAEVAQLVSMGIPGLAVMPPDVVAAIDQAAADANSKAVRRRGQELSHRLRHMSRSKHRGGVHPNLAQAAAAESEDEEAAAARRQRRGKRRQSRNRLLEQLTRSAALPVGVEQRQAAPVEALLRPLQAAVGAEEEAQAAAERHALAARSSIAAGGSLYDESAALAYAASRMPACYAALEAALREVAARRPGWRPDSMLDFGAGPGTAVWAAQRVWRQQPLEALAVEPSAAMSWLGHEVQQRQRQQYEAALQRQAAAAAGEEREGGSEEEEGEEEEEAPVPPPRLRWMHKLPPRYRAAQGRQYGLATAGYVLGELRGEGERRRLVAELWARTAPGGVLLLVEPGTPRGASHIQQARSQLLEAAQQQRQAEQQQQDRQGAGEASGSGAHVVAPCPHDGGCPMEGRPSWCHFVQRFQRTRLQRGAKALAGVQPRTYQDERFSYVALAKAARPAVHGGAAQPLIAGSFFPDMADPQEALTMPANLTPRRVPADARPFKRYSDSEGEEVEEDEENAEGFGSDGSTERAGSSGEWGGVGSSSSSSDSDSEEAAERGAGMSAIDGEGRPGLDGLDEATRRLLLESMLEGEDEDAAGGRAGLEADLERELRPIVAAAHQRQAAAAKAAVAADRGGRRREAAPLLAPVSPDTADVLYEGGRVDWERQEPEAVAAALRASGGWSRIVRTPRKRKGHVVLDVCSAAPAHGSGDDAGQPRRGVLLRQTVARAAALREAGGTAPYRLARRLRWGDLWPAYYQQRFRAEEPPKAQP